MTMRQAAADELALRLKKAADELAGSGLRAKRVPYGRGRAGGLIRPRSPKGFVLNAAEPQLLLPDGRLWIFHSRLDPAGIFYDAAVDHERSRHGSIPFGDAQFSYLGAVVQSYSFGYLHGDDSSEFELGAIIGKAGETRFVGAGEAIAGILEKQRAAAKS